MNNLQPAKFFEVIKTYHKHINDDFEQPQIIIPKLRSYQRRAVKWMVDREKNNDCKLKTNIIINLLFCNYLNKQKSQF